MARPALPAALRYSLADRVDRRLATILGASLIVHLSIAAWAWVNDLETEPRVAAGSTQTYRHELIEVALPDVVEVAIDAPDAAPAPGVAAPVRPAVQTPAPVVERPRITRPAPTMSAAEAARLAAMVTGADAGPGGFGEQRARQPGADLGAQIDAVGDRQVTIGDDGGGFRAAPGPRLGTERGPLVDAPTEISRTPRPTDETVRGRISIRPQPGGGPETTLTADAVLAKINGVYMAGLQRCYKQGLLGDASLGGKVALAFTVTPRGALDDISAAGVTAEVDACIRGQMRSWRFAIPRDADGEATDADFRLSLALQPS